MKRFLIVNPFGIGDVIFNMPMINAIKAENSKNYIGFLCNIRTAPIVLANPQIDKVFIFEKDEYRQLWRNSKIKCIKKIMTLRNEIKNASFDIAFDISMAQEYGLFLKLSGIRKRIGYDYKRRGIFLTHKVKLPFGYYDKHIVDYYLDLLKLADIELPLSPKFELYIPEENKQKCDELLLQHKINKADSFICMAPGAGASWGDTSYRKHWPRKCFAEVANNLISKKGLKVILLGNGYDKTICDYISDNAPGCVNLCSETDLLTFSAIVARSRVLITNDGGPLHVAVALGTKTVSVFGPVDEQVYGPYIRNKDNIVVKNDKLNCRPCYKNFKIADCQHRNCLNDVSSNAAIKVIYDVLEL